MPVVDGNNMRGSKTRKWEKVEKEFYLCFMLVFK